MERLRREYNFEISAKQYREAIVRATDSGGIWSVEEVLVLKRLNQLSNDDLLRMQYTSCLVKFMLGMHPYSRNDFLHICTVSYVVLSIYPVNVCSVPKKVLYF